MIHCANSFRFAGSCRAHPPKKSRTLVVAFSGTGNHREGDRNHSDGGFGPSTGTSRIYPLRK